ncbi:hypothetical protein NDU88_002264 [Pleurodeles waltl]|uniref:Uncharacterized protein n=1 Tax=Pleurodeles waltl TaxID=8319 RepID=A0AAV7M0D7_PLEWA|nr:hypothetical protein NDU88_002264 [Pleurodeles waltl]
MVVPAGTCSRVDVAPPVEADLWERQPSPTLQEYATGTTGEMRDQARDSEGSQPGELVEMLDDLDNDEDSVEVGELGEGTEDEWWCARGWVSNHVIKSFQTPAPDNRQHGQAWRVNRDRPPALTAGRKCSAVRTGAIWVVAEAKVGTTQDQLYKGVYVTDVGVGPEEGEGGLGGGPVRCPSSENAYSGEQSIGSSP